MKAAQISSVGVWGVMFSATLTQCRHVALGL